MKQNKFISVLILILVLGIMTAPVSAWQKGKNRGQKELGLEAKFSEKIESLLGHKDIIDLKEEQIKQIKELMINTKKELIRINAEIEIVSIDINTNLFETDKIDLKTMEKLLDQKYKFKKDKAKILVRGFAQVKDILTKEQKDILKDVKGQSKKQCLDSPKCGSLKSMGKCPMNKAPEAMSK